MEVQQCWRQKKDQLKSGNWPAFTCYYNYVNRYALNYVDKIINEPTAHSNDCSIFYHLTISKLYCCNNGKCAQHRKCQIIRSEPMNLYLIVFPRSICSIRQVNFSKSLLNDANNSLTKCPSNAFLEIFPSILHQHLKTDFRTNENKIKHLRVAVRLPGLIQVELIDAGLSINQLNRNDAAHDARCIVVLFQFYSRKGLCNHS